MRVRDVMSGRCFVLVGFIGMDSPLNIDVESTLKRQKVFIPETL